MVLELGKRHFGPIAYATRPDSDRNPRFFRHPHVNKQFIAQIYGVVHVVSNNNVS